MVKQQTKKYKFEAKLIDAGGGGVYVNFPYDVEKEFGIKGQVKVTSTIDGVHYRGSLANMGTGGHILIVLKTIRKKINKNAGDSVKIVIEQDTQERVVEIPETLKELLSTNTTAKSFFDSLSYTNRKEYARWITTAKREETQQKRLSQVMGKLLAGKKNPNEK